jgi:hypothetical protein
MHSPQRSPTTPVCTHTGLASSAFARHYSRNHYCFIFLLLLRCFSSEGSRLLSVHLQCTGLPHSDTCGSRVVCTSPQFFAAYRVLRRLREPRHPPCALGSLPFLWDTSQYPISLSRMSVAILILTATYLAAGRHFTFFAFTPSSLVNELFAFISPFSSPVLQRCGGPSRISGLLYTF